MKKITFLVAALCATMFVSAAETTVTTCDFTAKTANNANYNTEWSYGADWTLFGAANNNGAWAFMKFGGKKETLATANPCWAKNATEIASPITKITVTTNVDNLKVAGSTVDVWGVLVYSDASRTTLIDSVVGGTMTRQVAESLDLLPTNGTSWPASSYYTVFFKMSNSTTTNGIAWIDAIAFKYDDTVTALGQVTSMSVYANNGTIYGAENGRIYTILGIDVTEQNGRLNGVYVVKINGKVQKVMVR
ncbi:MAG TPA: hypothetical protein P5073_05990 [Paludibacteraceae bacterium]|nr:hypothetical protein [Paludibacteraceae bacterium]